jgi:hypothetical protein
MTDRRSKYFPTILALASVLGLAACAETAMNGPPPDPAAAAAPKGPAPAPPRIAAQELVGRWGYAAFHRPEDRTRIETQARGQCGTPYVISASSAGSGISMFGHDNPNLQEMTTKGTVDGRTFVGPPGDPAGADDREIVSFDGRVLVLKWVDPEVAGRYGTAVLVRCGPRA